MIGVAHFAVGRDAVAPSKLVGLRGGSDGGIAIALVTLDLGEDVEGVGVEERIRSAFSGIPDLVEKIARDGEFALAAVEFGEGGENGEFFFDSIDRAGAGESGLEAFGGGIQTVQA